jgi:hypothetical protein
LGVVDLTIMMVYRMGHSLSGLDGVEEAGIGMEGDSGFMGDSPYQ